MENSNIWVKIRQNGVGPKFLPVSKKEENELIEIVNSKKDLPDRKILSFYDNNLPEKFQDLFLENDIANEGPGFVIDNHGRLLYIRLNNLDEETESELCRVIKKLEIPLLKADST